MLKQFSDIADNAKAMEATTTSFRPGLRSADFMDKRSWALVSSANAFSYPHMDGSGLPTFVQVIHGRKIWGICRPKYDDMDVSMAPQLVEQMREALRREDEEDEEARNGRSSASKSKARSKSKLKQRRITKPTEPLSPTSDLANLDFYRRVRSSEIQPILSPQVFNSPISNQAPF